jgi:hypothetical protein
MEVIMFSKNEQGSFVCSDCVEKQLLLSKIVPDFKLYKFNSFDEIIDKCGEDGQPSVSLVAHMYADFAWKDISIDKIGFPIILTNKNGRIEVAYCQTG